MVSPLPDPEFLKKCYLHADPRCSRNFPDTIFGFLDSNKKIVELPGGYLVQTGQESSSNYPCRVFSIHNQGKPPILCEGHTDVVLAISGLADKRFFASASADKTVRVWNAHTGACVHVLEGHRSVVLDITQPNPKTLISASADNTLKEWDLTDGTCRHTWRGHPEEVTHVITFSANIWVSASLDGLLMAWPSGQRLEGHSQSISALAQYKTTLFSGSYDHTVRVWQQGEEGFVCAAVLSKHNDLVTDLLVCEQERLLLSCSNDNTIGMWSLQAPYACIRILEGLTAVSSGQCFISTLSALAGGFFIDVSKTMGEGEKCWFSIRSLDDGSLVRTEERRKPIVAIQQCVSDPQKIFILYADCWGCYFAKDCKYNS